MTNGVLTKHHELLEAHDRPDATLQAAAGVDYCTLGAGTYVTGRGRTPTWRR
jgi:hypothetical protein